MKYINPSIDIPLCEFCNGVKKFSGFTKGFMLTCGNSSCRAKYVNKYYKDNQKAGCKKRNKKWKSEVIDGKTKQQLIILSGASKRKSKQTETSKKISIALSKKDDNGLNCVERSMLKTHGVTNIMKLPSVVEKVRTTFRDNYGVDWMTQSEVVKDKINLTFISSK
jgi:uncharacterized glyoxalase superfamily protein PhnB